MIYSLGCINWLKAKMETILSLFGSRKNQVPVISVPLPPINHRQARPLYSVQGSPLFSNGGDSLVFPLNKEELLLGKDEGEKANGLT